jgi:hypothetical protein
MKVLNIMWRFLAGLSSLFLICLLFNGLAEAMRLKTTWGERADLSEKIVRGKVVAVKSYWNPGKTFIDTDVRVLVDEYLKGDGPSEIVFKIPGGTVDNQTQWVSDTPQFSIGDYYVILLDASGRVTGGPDGVYLLKGEDGERFLLWLRAYVAGDPRASKEGPAAAPRVLPNQGGTQ